MSFSSRRTATDVAYGSTVQSNSEPLLQQESFDIVSRADASSLRRQEGDGHATEAEHSLVSRFTSKIVHNFRKIFIFVSIPLTVILCILGLALYFTDTVQARTVGATIPGYCAFASTILTFALVWSHLTVYTNPTEQRYIIRIIILCPIYAIDSWIALIAYKEAVWVGLIRDCYEAYVIYMFFQLMVGYIGGVDQVISLWRQEQPTMDHPFPLCCLPPLKLTKRVMRVWQALLLQYVVLNPLLTIISVVLVLTEKYKEGDFTPGSAWLWLSGLRFVSVTLAFTSLVYFYIGTKSFMASDKPLGKFASVKIVVFLSFWQTVALAVLNHFEIIKSTRLWTSDDVTTGLGNFMIAVEMYLVSVAHAWIFDEAKYVPIEGRQSACQCWKIKHLFSISDVITDTRDRLFKPISTLPVKAAAQLISAATTVVSPLHLSDRGFGRKNTPGKDQPADSDAGTSHGEAVGQRHVSVKGEDEKQSQQQNTVTKTEKTKQKDKRTPPSGDANAVETQQRNVQPPVTADAATIQDKQDEEAIKRTETEDQWSSALRTVASTTRQDPTFMAEAQKLADSMSKNSETREK